MHMLHLNSFESIKNEDKWLKYHIEVINQVDLYFTFLD